MLHSILGTDLLAGVERIRDTVLAGAGQAELDRTLPTATVTALRESGVLTMKVPAVLGGGEADLLTQIDAIEALAYLDASAGWCAMVGASAIGWAGAFLHDDAIAQVFAHNEIPTASVVVQPTGTAVKATGGYRVSGTWVFASGIRHAHWVVAGALTQDSEGSGRRKGVMLVMPKEAVTIVDDWFVSGLQGTGSCGFNVKDVFVPDAFAWSFPHGRARRGGPLHRLGWPGFVIHEPAAFALGVGRRALDAIVGIEQSRNGETPSCLVGSNAAFRDVARAELRLRSARALVREVFAHAWDQATTDDNIRPRLQGEMRAVAAFTTEVAVDIATSAFRHAGSKAVFSSSPIGRCLCDMQAAGQHWLVRESALGTYGQFLLGVSNADPLADAR